METGAIIFFVVFVLFAAAGLISLIMYLISRSKGKITISLEKIEYAAGETINGRIILNLKKPVVASALNVTLIGERKTTNYSVGSKGVSKQNKTQRIFEFKKPIDSSGNYVVGEKSYNFDLKIPTDIIKNTTGNQVLDSVVKSVQAITGNMGSIKWYVLSDLEMKGFNISKKIQINIV